MLLAMKPNLLIGLQTCPIKTESKAMLALCVISCNLTESWCLPNVNGLSQPNPISLRAWRCITECQCLSDPTFQILSKCLCSTYVSPNHFHVHKSPLSVSPWVTCSTTIACNQPSSDPFPIFHSPPFISSSKKLGFN